MRPSDLKSLKRMLSAIHDELSSLRKAVQEGATSLISQCVTQQKATEEEWEKVNDLLARPHRTDPQEQATNEANEERRHWWNFGMQGVLTLGTWLAFFAAAIYAYEAHQQLNAMWKTYKEMQTQTTTSQQQTTLMREQLVGTQAAVLEVRIDNGLSTGGTLTITLLNAGVVQATGVDINIVMSREKDGHQIGNAFPFTEHIQSIPHNSEGYIIQPLFPWRSLPEYVGKPETWNPDWPGSVVYKVSGNITYDHGFGDPRQNTPICYKWVPTHATYAFDPTGKATASPWFGHFTSCDRYDAEVSTAKEKAAYAKQK